MHKGSLGVKQVELVVEAAPCRGDSGSVGEHAHAARNLGEISSGDVRWWFIADTEFEAGGTPVHELDCSLGLDDGNGSVDVLGDDITAVEKRASHLREYSAQRTPILVERALTVLSFTRIALYHLVPILEAGESHFGDRVLLVVRPVGRNDRSKGSQREMDTREAKQSDE